MIARDLMRTDYERVRPEAPAKYPIDDKVLRRSRVGFVVDENSPVSGLLEPALMRGMVKGSRERTMFKQLMVPVDCVAWVTPEEDLDIVLDIQNDGNLGVVSVVDGEEVVGVVIRDHLLRLMTSRPERGRR